jgi:probable phosphoglycerate mutase
VARKLIVEADGGSRGNPGPAAYGALVRDAVTGMILVEIAEHIGVASNNVAEYRGLIAGLSAALEVDPEAEVEARLDSKLVVEQLSGRWQVKHPDMKVLAKRALAVWPGGNIRFTWVPREQNKDADRLANEALDLAAGGLAWTPRAVAPSPDGARGTSVEPDEVAPPSPSLLGWGGPVTAPAVLLLLRHGQTADTAAKRFSGAGGDDPALDETGLQQAREAARVLADRGGIDAVVSSPLLRARQTAEAAAIALGLDVVIDEGVAECAFGDWEGLTFAQVRERWPAQVAAWLGSTAVPPPRGESFAAVDARVAAVRSRLTERYRGRTVLVVSHVTPIKALVLQALGAPLPGLFRLELQPASLSTVAWFPDGNASLRVFNDTSHLTRASHPTL